MAKLKEYFQHPMIRSALILGLAVGASIIAQTWAFKKLIGRPEPKLTALIPVMLLAGHQVARAYRKKWPWLAEAWVWGVLILLGTAAVIVYNYLKYS